jgi:hypothetical protein
LIQSFFRIGAKLMTLRAATFITELPRRSTMPKNGKMEMLLLVAERDAGAATETDEDLLAHSEIKAAAL